MRITWNDPGTRFFETGIGSGVLYPLLGPGVAWNGLVALSESSVGGNLEPLYYDGVKYADWASSEDFQAVLEAFAAPPEFAPCDGQKQLSPGLVATQQPRRQFGLCYRTLVGNDLVGAEFGYKLHLIYNCTAAPSSKNNQTQSADVKANTRSWTINTVPPPSSTFKPTAHLVVDSTTADPAKLALVEDALYGTEVAAPYLPTIPELVDLLN